MKLFLASVLSLLVIYVIRRMTDRTPDEFVDMPPEQVLRDVEAMCRNAQGDQAVSYLKVYCERFPNNVALRRKLIELEAKPPARATAVQGASNIRRPR